ncbi:AcrR family transcriptional regulator [Actinoplanes campanulatus]|uniref:AcrR family transcriptional regulator n=1 Tax=Actinoplanes campanulatus TaxID=113559 RepID=A0A7W5FHG5_9ACTN|nr:TetR/AcrR family transcriptional regulator [Actinoplanes campanulatus]MBB3098561.1 AcrR family transcriptional regulator [Actinoplanes campanulatus]GGN35910.1 TetR family transcriptional regulator [Actinoplanes campanulatus]GID39255.1 TetR family transcriptional regulator [Actinoplanes campanulatus]
MSRRQSDTKADIRRVALELFTQRGYEATSLREIAERLGVTKAALYYHFHSKEDIVRSLFGEHLAALDDLVAWATQQPPGPDLRAEVIDRMLRLSLDHGRQTMQFALANQHVVRDLHPGKENMFERLRTLFEVVTGPDAGVEETLRIRVALLSINTTVFAAQGLGATDEQIAAAVRDIAHRLTR